jgi:hypothetical protein
MGSIMRLGLTVSDQLSAVLRLDRPTSNLGNLTMLKNVIARIYVDGSVEYVPPSDLEHPPVQNELRITLEDDNTRHLERFNGGHWVELGEATDELLKKHGLDDLSGS